MKSYLDLINECDNFPLPETHPTLHARHIATYYLFKLRGRPHAIFGYVLPSVAEVLRNVPGWELDDEQRTLTMTAGDNEPERSAHMASTLSAMRETGHFQVLKGWRNELYPVFDGGVFEQEEEDEGGDEDEEKQKPREVKQARELVLSVERSASPLFGIVTYGSHMTVYTRESNSKRGEGYKFWIPRRARHKSTYGGMLDNTVAGGIATGETAWSCIVREADEEASVAEDLIERRATSVGAVTYFHIRDERAGGETGLLQPECEFTYDLDATGEDFTPVPNDNEAEEFVLIPTEDVQQRLKNGEFKPNCALVLIDFFIRHGILTPENEPDYIELLTRLHRRFEFPTQI